MCVCVCVCVRECVRACVRVCVCVHFWQNDRDLLLATAVTRGWNGYRSRSEHGKFSRPSCRGSNPKPSNHESGALTTELSSLPCYPYLYV